MFLILSVNFQHPNYVTKILLATDFVNLRRIKIAISASPRDTLTGGNPSGSHFNKLVLNVAYSVVSTCSNLTLEY